MLAKQFWRISHNPQSLVAKTFKAEYFPDVPYITVSLNPTTWFWRNIIRQENPKLREGRWLVGKKLEIPLNRPNWFQCPEHNLQNPNLIIGIVADLIDHSAGVWKANLVKAIYPFPQCSEILSIPISKTGVASDKLLWKHSTSGEYKVKNAYNLLLRDFFLRSPAQLRSTQFPAEIWKSFGKYKFLMKLVSLCGSFYMTTSLPS